MTVERTHAQLVAEVDDHGQWYHTIELAPGVLTPGWFDLRSVPDKIPMPPHLEGLRCLDVATFDGFWAFCMERRGAAGVEAIDLRDSARWDWPAGSQPDTRAVLDLRKQAGAGFELAREVLGSQVNFTEMSVYDLAPEHLGTFDFVYVGSLLLHLRDPVGALQAIRSVCRGRMLLVDAIHLPATLTSPRRPVATFDGIGRPWWWKPNRAALLRMLAAAGFEVLGRPRTVMLPPGAGQTPVPVAHLPAAMREPESRAVAFRSRVGDPHLAVLARPAG